MFRKIGVGVIVAAWFSMAVGFSDPPLYSRRAAFNVGVGLVASIEFGTKDQDLYILGCLAKGSRDGRRGIEPNLFGSGFVKSLSLRAPYKVAVLDTGTLPSSIGVYEDGHRHFIACMSGDVLLYDSGTGKSEKVPGIVATGIAFCSRTAELVSWMPKGDTCIWAWQQDVLIERDRVDLRQRDGCGTIAISPDGRSVACGQNDATKGKSGSAIRVVSRTALDRPLLEVRLPLCAGPVRFSPVGNQIAISEFAGALGLWSIADQRVVWRVAAGRSIVRDILQISFRCDGKYVSVSGRGGVEIFEVSTGMSVLSSSRPSIAVASFARVEQWLVIAAEEPETGTIVVELWDVAFDQKKMP